MYEDVDSLGYYVFDAAHITKMQRKFPTSSHGRTGVAVVLIMWRPVVGRGAEKPNH
jgi:hypothetical protein